jgi:hypothetical protein
MIPLISIGRNSTTTAATATTTATGAPPPNPVEGCAPAFVKLNRNLMIPAAQAPELVRRLLKTVRPRIDDAQAVDIDAHAIVGAGLKL